MMNGNVLTRSGADGLSGQIEAQLDPVFVQLDPIALSQQFNVKLPLELAAYFMYLKSALNVDQGLAWGDFVDGGQPSQGALSVAGFDGESDVFDLVAAWAKRDQTIEALNQSVIVVYPYFMGFDRVCVAGSGADFADMTGLMECFTLQPFPGFRTNIRADIAVPAAARHQFDR